MGEASIVWAKSIYSTTPRADGTGLVFSAKQIVMSNDSRNFGCTFLRVNLNYM